MKTIVEFRVLERHASAYLPDDLGVRLSLGVRKVVCEAGDPVYVTILGLQRQLRDQNDNFYLGWDVRRRYTRQEIAGASAFVTFVSACFEPTGEECGTEYDETVACAVCGSGRRQVSGLRLNTNRIPRSADIARTIGDEIIVSQRLRDLLKSINATGAHLSPVQHVGKSQLRGAWFQVQPTRTVRVTPPTRFGIGLDDDDSSGRYRCPVCSTAGINVLSEIWFDKATWTGDDFAYSLQFVGYRSGLLRPRPLLLVTPRIYALFRRERIRGAQFEVAHPVQYTDVRDS